MGWMVPHSCITGQPCDICDIEEFVWCEWIYYGDEAEKISHPIKHIIKCLGQVRTAKNAMNQ